MKPVFTGSLALALAGMLALAVAVGSVGCGSTESFRAETPPEVSVPAVEGQGSMVVRKADTLDETPLVVEDIVPDDSIKVEGAPRFPERKVAPLPKVTIAEYPANLIKGIKDPDAVVKVAVNLDATSLMEIVPLFAELLEFSYQIDPAVSGSVTMVVDSEMTAREAWEMFEHILWLSGAYASRNPGFIHILPFSKMPTERRMLVTHDPMANVEVAFIPVYYTKSAEVMRNIQPFITEGATVSDLTAANTLLIVEAPANMPKLRELISRLDMRGEAAWPHLTVHVANVDVEELHAELEELLPVLGFPVATKSPSGGEIKITSLPRLKTIVASAALPEVLEEVERWIAVLDRSDRASRERIFFYNVRHSTAKQLQEVLETFFNTTSTVSSAPVSDTKSTSSKATSRFGRDRRERKAPEPETPPTPTAPRTSSSGEEPEEGSDSIFDTKVVVHVDEVQNRLTIRTTQRAYALVSALLERVDVAPPQVMIEANIVEVRLTKATEFGFAYAATHSDKFQFAMDNTAKTRDLSTNPWDDDGDHWPGVDPVMGLFPANPATTAAATGGAAIGWVNGDRMAFIRAVAGEGNTRILSAPQIMAATGEEAVIQVGTDVAIKTTEYYGTDVRDSANFEYKETGTIMTVKPYITAGNQVRLRVTQEVSAVVDDREGVDPNAPDISTKMLDTTLVIPDGGTAMMGGLIDTATVDGHSGIPYLKEIPYIGRLFRTNFTASDRTELLVLMTVYVVNSASDTEPLLRRYEAALQEIREQLEP